MSSCTYKLACELPRPLLPPYLNFERKDNIVWRLSAWSISIVMLVIDEVCTLLSPSILWRIMVVMSLSKTWYHYTLNDVVLHLFPSCSKTGTWNPSQPIPNLKKDVRGVEKLWQPSIINPYLIVLSECSRPASLEAAAGTLQNVTAGEWQVGWMDDRGFPWK